MIVSVSDILKALDKIPEWVGLKRLLNRVTALEEKVAELEAKLGAQATKPKGEPCPFCGGALKVTAIEPDSTFGMMGVEKRTLECQDCNQTITRQVDPNKMLRP